MKRKEFLIKSGWLAFGVSASIIMPACNDDTGLVEPNENNTNENCSTTTKDILGPFYRAGAPSRNSLRISGSNGQLLKISGLVQDGDCNALARATVEVWHADHDGNYDNDSSDFRYRGQIESGENGSYYFDTILPGKYLNGADYRPSHIHFKVTAAGYKELVSQVYFKNDSHIEKDPWASDPSAKLRILEMTDNNGVTEVTFNITLDKQ